MTKANGTPSTPAAASVSAKKKANHAAAAPAPASHKKSKHAPAAAAAAANAVPPPPPPQSQKKQKSRPSSAAASAAAADDEDEIALFHPGTAVAAQPELDSAAAAAAAATAAAEADEDDEDDVTSSSFFSSLVRSQTPALLSVLSDLQSKVKELRKSTLRPLLASLSSQALPTSEGMSFLEMKNQVLVQYMTHLVLFVMCKLAPPCADERVAAAAAARQSGIVRQLVYLRAVLEKLRPLDKKLKYSIDKMAKLAAHINLKAVEAAQRGEDAEAARADAEAEAEGDAEMGGAAGAADPLSFRPNPSALLAATADASRAHAEVGASAGTGLASGASGLYRPPRLSATQLDDADKATSKRNKDLARAAARAKGNAYLTSLRADLSERPEERALDLDDMRPRSTADLEREEYETTNLLRLTDTRADKARRKEARRVASGLADLADGGEHDDFRDMRRLKGGRGEMEGFGGAEDMSEERMEELRAQAAPRKRKGGNDDEDNGAFDDPAESRHAKKRRGPNGKNSFGSKFASRGGGGGRGGRGGGGRGRR